MLLLRCHSLINDREQVFFLEKKESCVLQRVLSEVVLITHLGVVEIALMTFMCVVVTIYYPLPLQLRYGWKL
ncbi:hypothetical protein Hanom_Chr14g01335101 [Helianthus anomalus]